MPQKTSEVLGEAFELGGLVEVSFQGVSEVSGMEWCIPQRSSEVIRVLAGIKGGVKS